MAADSAAYSKIAIFEVGAEGDGAVATNNPDASSCAWKLLVLVSGVAMASFAAGFGVAIKWFPAYRYLEGSISCDVVSYGFLESPQGKQLQAELNDIWTNQGSVASLQHMAQLMTQNPQIASSCHPFLHQLGHKAFIENPKVGDGSVQFLEAAFAEFLGTPNEGLMRTCNAAYMHGLIGDSLKNLLSKQTVNITSEASWIQNNLCGAFQPLDGKGLSDEWECQHGVGHGILQHQRVMMQRAALEQALQICQQSSADTEACQNGIWMEYWVYQGMTIDMDFDGDKDPLSICTELAAINSCRLYAPTAYLLRHPHDYLGSMKIFCRGGDEFCVRGMGMQVAKENMLDFLPVEEVCLAGPRSFQRKCFAQGVNYYQTASKSDTIPSSLCENLNVFKRQCKQYT